MEFGWLKPEALLRRQAADLLARLEADPNPQNREQVERFRALGPRHAAAVRRSEEVLSTSRLLGDEWVPAQSSDRPASRLALAASIAAALVAIPALYLTLVAGPGAMPVQAATLSTNVGEIRRISLADGSIVTLDTSSRVRVDLGKARRGAIVERGRARFSIPRRKMAFTVRAGEAAVNIEAGTLDVAQSSGGTRLELIAGAARLSPAGDPARSQRVIAPTAIDHPATAEQRITRPDHRGVDWTSGRLSFEGASLADVAAAANRYSSRQILISDQSIEAMKVTGVYRAGDTPGLARSLASALDLQVRQDRAGNFILERRSHPR